MIYIFGEKNSLLQNLPKEFKSYKIESEFFKTDHLKIIQEVYAAKESSVQAIITECKLHDIHSIMWIDLLEGLSRRLPVLVIGDGSSESVRRLDQTSGITWLQKPKDGEILDFLRTCGVVGNQKNKFYKATIPIYNSLIATRILKTNGFLSVISIHASDFSKVSLEYGSAVYHQLQLALQKILYEMWGSSGAFRKSDILCRRSAASNTFYILLEHSRNENLMPMPGDLETLAQRLSIKLENLMWKELTSASRERILPKFLDIVPRFIVSYASALYNPCVDNFTTMDLLLRNCRETAKIQDSRMLNRQRELIQTLIQKSNLLHSNFQGVFDLRTLKIKEIQALKEGFTIDAIAHSIFAFEALARINKNELQKLVGEDTSLNVDYLNPGVLFAKAEEVNLKLELDQACFKLAMQNFHDIPGKLMVNILPRNFYFLEDLRHSIPDGLEVIFEVSETEAINNMSLIQSIREKISENSYGIAIDDFGKGYAGVDRVIKLRPTIIKLDQILINQIDKDTRMQSFISGLVDAVRSTQSLVLAEGVETKQELLTLAEIGIDLVQGFYLHRPEELETIISNLKKK